MMRLRVAYSQVKAQTADRVASAIAFTVLGFTFTISHSKAWWLWPRRFSLWRGRRNSQEERRRRFRYGARYLTAKPPVAYKLTVVERSGRCDPSAEIYTFVPEKLLLFAVAWCPNNNPHVNTYRVVKLDCGWFMQRKGDTCLRGVSDVMAQQIDSAYSDYITQTVTLS
jgi:hypothetical protein